MIFDMEHILYNAGNLKRVRVVAKFTQEQAAKQLNISVQTLRVYEQDNANPSVNRLREFGRLYGVSFII